MPSQFRLRLSPGGTARLVVAAILFAWAVPIARAQDAPASSGATSALIGYVIDVAGRPMADVEVYIAGTDRRERTNARGFWRFVNPPTGPRVVVAREIGYAPYMREVVVGSAVNDTLPLLLRRYPRTLSTVEVRARMSAATVDADVLAERLTQMRVGTGRLYTREQILQARAYSIAELVQGVPGITLERGRGDGQGSVIARSTRSGVGIGTVSGQQCQLQFFLNTTPIDNETVGTLNPMDFRSVEVYPQAVLLPGLPQRPDKCGAIVINMMAVRR